MSELIRRAVSDYYTKKVNEHGRTPRGADWRDEESQALRFEQLLKLVNRSEPYSLIDYGCGYGALAEVLVDSGDHFSYHGFDVSSEMLARARQALIDPRIVFEQDGRNLPVAEYALASGVLNVRLQTPDDEWRRYAVGVIGDLDAVCRRGFAFNMLSAYSDPERRRADLYYADPCYFFDICKRTYSRNVTLLHDYGLYEFTILVRK
jgi:SAM-dependent methyltransferase